MHELTMKEQFAGLLADNEGRYPDAMRYLRECLEKENIDDMLTEYEKFAGLLDGTYSDFWSDCPYDNSRGNKVDMVKWYRNKTGLGLKDSKEACEARLLETHGTTHPYKGTRPATNGYYRQ